MYTREKALKKLGFGKWGDRYWGPPRPTEQKYIYIFLLFH